MHRLLDGLSLSPHFRAPRRPMTDATPPHHSTSLFAIFPRDLDPASASPPLDINIEVAVLLRFLDQVLLCLFPLSFVVLCILLFRISSHLSSLISVSVSVCSPLVGASFDCSCLRPFCWLLARNAHLPNRCDPVGRLFYQSHESLLCILCDTNSLLVQRRACCQTETSLAELLIILPLRRTLRHSTSASSEPSSRLSNGFFTRTRRHSNRSSRILERPSPQSWPTPTPPLLSPMLALLLLKLARMRPLATCLPRLCISPRTRTRFPPPSPRPCPLMRAV